MKVYLKNLKKRLMFIIFVFSITLILNFNAHSQECIEYDKINKTVSVHMKTNAYMTDILKEFGEKIGISIKVDSYIYNNKILLKPISANKISIEQSLSIIANPYYFKLFVSVSKNISDSNNNLHYLSAIIYKKWNNNDCNFSIYENKTNRSAKSIANSTFYGNNGSLPKFKHGVRDWNSGDKSSDFSYGYKDLWFSDQWIDKSNNPELEDTADGDSFFAYVLGKENHSSAIVKAEAKRTEINGEQNVLIFTFYIIQGQIDDDGQSVIDYMTKLTEPKAVDYAYRTSFETLPDWDEYNGSNENVPLVDHDIYRNVYDVDGWSQEFEIKKVDNDPWLGNQLIINIDPIVSGYYLVFIGGGDSHEDLSNFEALCLVHVYSSGQKARFLVLDDGQIDDDGDVYINKFIIIQELNNGNCLNFDNVLYKEYKDLFLLTPLQKQSSGSKVIANYLPSHLLYSPENYTWDPTRYSLVKLGTENQNPYIDHDRNESNGGEGAIGKMFSEFIENYEADSNSRIPVIFIHGWQGAQSNAFDCLHDYSWSTTGDLEDNPTSGEAYWRNLLTYMYKYHGESFQKFKPYIYHYPSYKHVTFNARILYSLIEELSQTDKYFKENKDIIIIAHSMGTIVSRSLMEEYGLLNRIKLFISLAGVHHGSPSSMESLLDLSSVVPKDLYTPGACDLMSDNYDGLIDINIKDDIQSNTIAYELLEQRNITGNIYLNATKYDLSRNSFDLYYINQLGVTIDDNIYTRKDMEVPKFSNPWLLNLNKNFVENYYHKAKNKYILYTGFCVAREAAGLITVSAPYVPYPHWSNTLTDHFDFDGLASMSLADATGRTLSDEIANTELALIYSNPTTLLLYTNASFAYASFTGYKFNDSVVPLSSGILDFSRGRLLIANIGNNSIQINLNYNKNEHMPLDIPNYLNDALFKEQYIYKSYNDSGLKTRIIYDHHHDRMLNGGYHDPDIYRQNTIDGIGFRESEIHQDYQECIDPDSDLIMAFENDPLFNQIKHDLLELDISEVSKAVAAGQKYLFDNFTESGDSGYWSDYSKLSGTSAAVAALIETGKLSDPDYYNIIVKGINYIKNFIKEDGGIYDTKQIYETGMSIIALSLFDQDHTNGFESIIQNAVNFLETAQNTDTTSNEYGGWYYTHPTRDGDLSNTQYAVMGLWYAYRYLGKTTQTTDWSVALLDFLQKTQSQHDGTANEGAFSYHPNSSDFISGTMTGAGIWCLAMIGQETSNMVDKAINWFNNNYSWDITPGYTKKYSYYYYVYAMAKGLTAAIGTERNVGEHDWEQDLIKSMIQNQNEQGFWNATEGHDPGQVISTSWVLMSLAFADTSIESKEKPLADANLDNPIKGLVTISVEGNSTISEAKRLPIYEAMKDSNVELPLGAFEFSINNLSFGGSTLVTLDIPHEAMNIENPTSFVDEYGNIKGTPAWFKIKDGKWVELPEVPIEINSEANEIRVLLKDGGREDSDNLENGSIFDPGAPGYRLSNTPPIANAGEDITIQEGTTVYLDASKSTSSKSEELTFLWTVLPGSFITLSDNTSISPTFVAHKNQDEELTVITLILIVKIEDGLENSDSVKITITDNGISNISEDILSFKSITTDNLGIGNIQGGSIVKLESYNSSGLTNTSNKPNTLKYGLLDMHFKTDNIAGIVEFTLYCPNYISYSNKWYLYNKSNGWKIYSEAIINNSNSSTKNSTISVKIKDGGIGDNDGIENGIIECVSGLGSVNNRKDNNGNCFIMSASYRSLNFDNTNLFVVLSFFVIWVRVIKSFSRESGVKP